MKNYRVEFPAMGGQNEIVAVSTSEDVAKSAMRLAAREVLRIEQKYSRFRPSFISTLNTSAGNGEWHRCDDETIELLALAANLHEKSGGLFDITSGVLNKAWDFKSGNLPAEDLLHAQHALVGWPKVERQENRLRLPLPGMALDFGGFGKEYAADRAAFVLKQQGITAGYVNLQGDIAALGPQADGKPWLIGVQHPRKPGEIIATLPLSQGGLATSGDYEKFFEKNGRRYCHILNPRTGYPVNHWSSASVHHVSALRAGTLTTLAMLLEGAAEMFLQKQGCAYLLLDLACNASSGHTPTRGNLN